MRVAVKICGITSAEAADAAVGAGADFAGLVFFAGSPRHLSAEQAASLAARLRGRLPIVALLADARDEEIGLAVQAARPDFLQLHGLETPERVAAIKARFAVPAIKSIAIADASDLACVPAYEKVADMLLFDAKAPASAARPGGHGAAFDWQLLRGRRFSRPWILAGGLNAGNVARAIRAADAPGVDVSSSVETAPGIKDPQLIRAFIAAARQAEFAKEAHA
jgi:phosphoribosylanthranilate isomerase